MKLEYVRATRPAKSDNENFIMNQGIQKSIIDNQQSMELLYFISKYFEVKCKVFQRLTFKFIFLRDLHLEQMSQANQTIFNNIKAAIENKVREIVPPILQHQVYDPNKTKQFTTYICQQIVKELTVMNKNFKYITNCIIVEANGNGLDMNGVYYWDNQMDGFLTYKWEGKHLICIVNDEQQQRVEPAILKNALGNIDKVKKYQSLF